MVQVGQLNAKLVVDGKQAFVKDMGDAKKATSDVGTEFERVERKGSSSLNSLAATARKVLPALSIGAVIGAGWNRFTGIENAEMKLKGLGNTGAETARIMQSTLAAVKGTAFGLDEAANAAATATAAGVDAGSELQRYLGLVGDVAALTNSTFDDIARTMNRARTLGGAYNDTLQILAERGLPVYTLVANEIGKTTAEVKKLASQGEISAQVLEQALGSQVSGAALRMGETTTGQLKNVGAALSRVGADILGDIMPTVKTLADGVIFLADGWGKLPEPIKNATLVMGGFIALQRVGVFTKMAEGATGLVAQLRLVKTEGLAASATLSTLGKATLVGLAVTAAVAAYENLTAAHKAAAKAEEEHQARVDALTASLDANTGAATDNTRATVANDLQDSGTLDLLEKLGIATDDYTAAIVGNADAQARIRHAMQEASLAQFEASGQAERMSALLGRAGISNKEYVNSLIDGRDALVEWARANVDGQGVVYTTENAVGTFAGTIESVSRASASASESFGEYLGVASLLADRTGEADEATRKWEQSQLALGNAVGNTASIITGSARTAMQQWIADSGAATQANQALIDAVNAGGRSYRDYSDTAKLEARAIRGEFAQIEAEVTGSLDEIANAMAHQVDSMVSLHGAAGDLGASFGDFEGALRDANGELNLSSGSVRDLVTDMRAYGDAAQDAAAATYDQTGSLDAAAAVAAQARDEFIALMMSQGETRAEAERLATQMGILDSITINGKVFTITAIDNATPVLSRIAQLAAMLGITTQNAGLSAGAAMSDWLRKNPTQINDAFQSAISNVKIDATSTSAPGRAGGGGGGGGGASKAEKEAEKRAKDLAKKINDILGTIGKPAPKLFDFDQVTLKSVLRDVRVARKAVADAVNDGLDEKAARQFRRQLKEMAEAARAEFAAFRIDTAADRVRDALAGVGRAPSKPFDLESVGADVLVGQLAAAGVELKKAIKAGLDKKQAKELRGELTEMSAEFGRQMQDVFTRIRTEGFAALQDSIDPASGSVSAMRSAMGQLVDDLRTIGASDKSLGKMTLLEGRLTHAMDQRAAVTEQLSQAQSELNRLMEQYQQRVDSVRDSIVAYANITNVQATNSIGWISSVDDLIGQMGQQSSEITSFIDDIAKLRSMGLNETTLRQLEDAGPGQGWAQARLLADSTGDQIREINRLAEDVFGQGNRLGKMSADSMYGSGISAAQSMVDGLLAQRELLQTTIEGLAGDAEILAASEMEIQGKAAADGIIAGLNSKKSQLNRAIRNIGKEMIATFKAAMEIASPSKRMAREIGAPMGMGVIDGFVKTIEASGRMADSLPRIAVPAAAVGRSVGAAAASSVGGSASVGRIELVVRSDGGKFENLVAGIVDVRITDTEGRELQAARAGSFGDVQ